MAKILLFSDIHIHTHKNSLERLDNCLEALDWVCHTAYDKSIEDVVFLGDLFQDRQKIQVLPYKRTYDVLRKWSKHLNFYLLLGNHDLWYSDKWNVSSVAPFDSLSGATVIDEPRMIEISGLKIDFLPYTKNPIKIVKELLSQPEHGRILCGHVAIDGAKLNKVFTSDVSVEHEGDMVKVDSNLFKGYEKTFLGHYHMAQKCKHNVEYVGSPLQLNFGEAHQDKHIIILDTEDLSSVYIKNDFSPKHYIVSEQEAKELDLKNNFVRINFDDLNSVSDAVDVKKELLEEGALSVEFKKAPKKDGLKKDIDTTKDIFSSNQIEIIEKFVEAVGSDELKKEKLVTIGKKLWMDSQVN